MTPAVQAFKVMKLVTLNGPITRLLEPFALPVEIYNPGLQMLFREECLEIPLHLTPCFMSWLGF